MPIRLTTRRSTLACAVVATALVACQAERRETAADSAGGLPTSTPTDSLGAAPSTDSGRTVAASPAATALLKNASGRELGTLTVSEANGGLLISGDLRGLAPGVHAMHVHTTGQCDGPAFTSAGGHWNPTARQHGADNPQGPHLGDLPNVTVNADSTMTVNATVRNGTLRGANGLLDGDGAALVLHAKADDNRSDPAGNAGDRIACGVVQPPA